MRINEDAQLIASRAGRVPRYRELCVFRSWNAVPLTEAQNSDFNVLSEIKILQWQNVRPGPSGRGIPAQVWSAGGRARFGWRCSEGLPEGAAPPERKLNASVSLPDRPGNKTGWDWVLPKPLFQ